jgi:hypothetical protein
MKRPSIFIYQFHRHRIIQARSLHLYHHPLGISPFSLVSLSGRRDGEGEREHKSRQGAR